MTLSAVFGIIGGILMIGSYIPYIYHIVKRQTKPHAYTWIMWSVTQIIATIGILEGQGGMFAALTIGAGAVLSIVTLILTFPYGTRNVTVFDTVALSIGCVALFFWWRLDHPAIAITLVSLIDGVGFLPTYRKTWNEPWSESLLAWVLFVAGNLCAFFALEEYNFLTTVYIGTVTVAALLLILLSNRRRTVHARKARKSPR
ncbi:MAG TPA: hypothetical protein VGE31_03405 [Candidatus Paceibacterota bacterium]